MARWTRGVICLLGASALILVIVLLERWWNERYALHRILGSRDKAELLTNVKLLRTGRYVRAIPCLIVAAAIAPPSSLSFSLDGFSAAVEEGEGRIDYARFEATFWRGVFKPHVTQSERQDTILGTIRKDEDTRRTLESVRDDPEYPDLVRQSIGAALSASPGQIWSCVGCGSAE